MMDMFDTARAMAGTLKLCGITQEELGRRIGVSQSCVANKLRLLSFSPEMQEKIRASGVSERHARALLRLDNEDEQSEILDKVTERGLSVRECEALVDAKVDCTAPRMIMRADRLERIDTFRSTLTGSITTLRSLGVDAREWTSYIGSKMYITVCITE